MDRHRVESISHYIHPRETLIWSGKPTPGLKSRSLLRGILGLLLWTLVLWLSARNGHPAFAIWAFFFVFPLGGLVITTVRDAWQRRGTLYALTTHRALRLSADHLDSVDLRDLFDIIYSGDRANTGTIYCRARGLGTWPKRNPKGERRSLFRLIVDVDYVHQLLLEAQKRASLPQPDARPDLEFRFPPSWPRGRVAG